MRGVSLLNFVASFSFSPDEGQPGEYICTYPISGTYGVTPRYLLYLLLIICAFLHKLDWLVGSNLVTVMLYSATACIDSFSIAAKSRESHFLDPDIFPTLAITMSSTLAACFLLMWSSSIRRANESSRLIVGLWIMLLTAGTLAGFIVCGTQVHIVEDRTACPAGISLRVQQQPYWGSYSESFSLALKTSMAILPLNIIMGLTCAVYKEGPLKLTQRLSASKIYIWCSGGVVFAIVLALQVLVLLALLNVITCLEGHMLSIHGWPRGECMAKVGQWGAIAHASLTFGAGAIVGLYRWRNERRGGFSTTSLLQKASVETRVVRMSSFV
ncbi:hypothetical protein P167DRAFT_72711 [Morchella conica CCBAS932]|uniref:Uncharacterized protein n=1 Tax=Morchella conica CCBAS932 TaxID=1392247 RepID=A0A3N4K884_9PEZI|nr:hypothetical protein P167DRAFT_72711 [Morchella conica CCBAS932]